MYYLFLVAAVVLIGFQFSFMKLFQNRAGKTLFVSLLFTAACALLSALLTFLFSGCRLSVSPYTAVCAAVYAALLVLYNVLGIKALSLGSMTVYSMFMMMGGMLVPFFFGILYFHESVSAFQIAGVILLIAALALPAFGARGQRLSPLFLLVNVVIFFTNGGVSVVSKLQQTAAGAVPAENFIVLANLMTLALCLIGILLYLLFARKKSEPGIFASQARSVAKYSYFIALYALVSVAGFYLILLSAAHLPASVQYPIISGGAVVLSALADRLFFRTKLTPLAVVSAGMAFLATVLFVF